MVIVSSDIKVQKSFVWSSIHKLRGRVHMRAHQIPSIGMIVYYQ